MKTVVWLASYPKSGNTWLRALLTNLVHPGPQPASINALEGSNAAFRVPFDRLAGIDSSYLTPERVRSLRGRVFRRMAETSDHDPLLLKVHDAFPSLPGAPEVFPASVTRGVLYVVRDPRDIAPSYAHHNGSDLDAAIEHMAQEDACLARSERRVHRQLRQPLSTWRKHVLSWVDQRELPVHVVRYEDLQTTPHATLEAAARFAGLDPTPADLDRAVAFSDFRTLQAQERDAGFREGSARNDAFFRRGETGAWREELTPFQAEQIVADHGDVMERMGYAVELSPRPT